MEEKKTDTDTRTRTCAVILNKILKGDLSPEVAGIFKEKIKRTACSVTTDISELSFIVRSEMLALAAYGLRDQPMWTDIGRILPKTLSAAMIRSTMMERFLYRLSTSPA